MIVVTNEGEEAFLDLLTSVNYSLRLFKSDTDVTDATVVGDLTEADFAGYAAITLNSASWTTTPGSPSVATYAQQTFTRSSSGAQQLVYGYYVTTAGGALRWLEKFDSAVIMELINDAIKITPRLTLRDEGDV